MNLRVISEKQLQQQTPILQNYIDIKLFTESWHKGLWKVTSDHSVGQNMTDVTKSLYQNSQSMVMILGTNVQMFKTVVDVCQGCILLPTLFNLWRT